MADSIRITVVGDGFVGKTCLLLRFVKNKPPSGYEPTVFDNHATTIEVDGKFHQVELWDTAGQEDYDRIRLLSYQHTDCFVVCFAIDSPSSFENVKKIWMPELRGGKRKSAMILVGTKSDLRGDERGDVSQASALEMQKSVEAFKYVECSAVTNRNVEEVFREAIRATLSRKKRCILL